MATAKQPYVSISKQPKEIEIIPMKKRAIRKICKCPGAAPKLGEDQTSTLKFVFGPLYQVEKSSTSGKEDAWRRILEEDSENQDEITGTYLSAMRRVEKKARSAYGESDGALNVLTESEFRWMMIKDGCFFLQLALYLLGASKQLGYPENHLIFGEKQSKKTVQEWIKSMFLVGNQIPLVVLNELMRQKFFQKVIEGKGEWPRPSDMLSKQILHDMLVIPALEHHINTKKQKHTNLASEAYLFWKKLARKTDFPDQEQPSDLLHGLQLLLIGKGASKTDSTENDRKDELGDADLEAGIEFKSGPKVEDKESEGDGRKELIYMKGDENKDDERRKYCAFELRNKGIFIWKSKTAGSRGICFRNWIIFASLTLPTLKVNHDTNVLFTNLKYYEMAQQQQNEVRSYLRFLSELISTYEDVNVLASKGIIVANTPDEKERFLKMLTSLADSEITHQHRSVLGRVKDYSVFPWERFKYVAIVVFFLSIAQTVFGVLSYVVGVEQLHQSRP